MLGMHNYEEELLKPGFSFLEDEAEMIYKLYLLGFTRTFISKICNGSISYLLRLEKFYYKISKVKRQKYKNKSNIKLPSDVRQYFKDNTVLNTLIAQGKVSV